MEIMIVLADRYVIGIACLSFLIVVGYLVFSVLLVIRARRVGMDICVGAFIPFWNLVVWMRVALRRRALRRNSGVGSSDSSLLDDEEILL